MTTAGPTARSMRWLRSLGYEVEKVEHRLPRGFVTQDFMGFADLLAIDQGRNGMPFIGVLAVQATTSAHVQERVKKVQAERRSKLWLQCGNRIWVVGWGLRGAEGTRKLWTPKVLTFVPARGQVRPATLEMCAGVTEWEAIEQIAESAILVGQK